MVVKPGLVHLHIMSQGLIWIGVSVIMSSWGNGMIVMVVANNVHHDSTIPGTLNIMDSRAILRVGIAFYVRSFWRWLEPLGNCACHKTVIEAPLCWEAFLRSHLQSRSLLP